MCCENDKWIYIRDHNRFGISVMHSIGLILLQAPLHVNKKDIPEEPEEKAGSEFN